MKQVRPTQRYARSKALNGRAESASLRRVTLVSVVVISLISVLLISNMRGLLA